MKKKWWIAPLAIIGALLAECIVFLGITFVEYLMFEGTWGGNSLIDILVNVINIIAYIVFSYFFYYIILPYIFETTGMNYKVVSIILFVLFTFISVIQCLYMSECVYPDFLDYLWCYSLPNALPVPFDFKGVLAVVDIIFIFGINLIRPIFFTVSSYKSVKEKR